MKRHVLIIGAGPAGMNAAIEAYARGCEVTVVDEGARPGGQIYRQTPAELSSFNLGLPAERTRKRTLVKQFESLASCIDYRPFTTAYTVFPGPVAHLANASRSDTLRPDSLVIATGVGERTVPFPGWTLPGVIYAGGAQALMKANAIRPGNRVVVAGAGPLPIAVAAQLIEAGADVPALVLLHPLWKMVKRPWALWSGRDVVKEGFSYLRMIKKAKVKCYEGWIPVRARGETSLENVTIARHDGTGRARPSSKQDIICDTLAVNFGFTCHSELAAMTGIKSTYQPSRGGWIPLADPDGTTSSPGIFVAGDCAGLRGAWVASAEGRIAGAAAANHALGITRRDLSGELSAPFSERTRHSRFQEAVQEILHLPDGVWSWPDNNTLVCRCEGVTLGRLRAAFEDGHRSLDAAKRNTRAGMGWCGGRTCLQAVAALANPGGASDWFPPMRSRPLARPIPIGQIGTTPTSEHE